MIAQTVAMVQDARAMHDVGDRIAKRVAARYARLCWWAELDDLRQEAWVAVLEAERTWRPDGGAKLETYAERAAVLRLRAHLWSLSAPVTGRKGHGEVLAGMIRAPVSDAGYHASDAEVERAAVEAWWAELDEMVCRHVVEEPARRVLLGGERASAVAADEGMTIAGIRAVLRRARKALRADEDLRRLVRAGA